ncbi:MAG: phytanoyl-CoA dioxygenase family protein [Bacteroidia bacterium]
MNTILLSSEEKYAQQLTADHLQKAVHSFKSMGYIVLQQVYSPELITLWQQEFMTLLNEKVARFRAKYGENISANHDVNRWNMHIPTQSQLFFGEFFANPFVLQVISGIIGHENYAPVFIAADVAFPNSTFQSVHQDGGEFAIAVNIPLVKVTMENGPTEIWAGTHRRSSDSGQQIFSMDEMELSEAEIKAYQQRVPNEYITFDLGDISIRDLRMLHRGTENHSDQIRPYLSVIYYPVQQKVPYKVVINRALEKAKRYREMAFVAGKTPAIDWANMMGRLPNIATYSDRADKHLISKEVGKQLSNPAKYMLRFAQFEEEGQNPYLQTTSLKATFQFIKEFNEASKQFHKLL